MKLVCSGLLTLGFLIFGGCTTNNSNSKEALNHFYEQWFGSMENADVNSFIDLLADDFYLKGPSQPAITDKEKLRNQLKQFHRNFTETVEWKLTDIKIYDNEAWVRLSERTTFMPKGEGDSFTLEGVHIGYLICRPDGNWKLKADISSLNHPPPSMQ